MTIRSKSILAIALTFITIILLLWVISRFLLLENLNKLESENALNDLNRLSNTITYITADLDMITAAWTSGNDTYAFITDQNEDTTAANPVKSIYRELRLNYIFFLDMTGRVMYSGAREMEDGAKIPPEQEIIRDLQIEKLIAEMTNTGAKTTGFIFPAGSPPLIISIKPILDSRGQEPGTGFLVFGRFISTAETNEIKQLTSLAVDFIRVNDDAAPDELKDIYLELKEGTGKLTKPWDAKIISGYMLLPDIYNEPGAIIKADIPRSISQEGQLSIQYFLIVITIICVFFGLMAMISAEKEGLARLKSLANSVETIAASGKATGRLPFKGKDEIATLAAHINHMLASLQQSEKALKEKAEHLQTAVIEAQLANQAKTDFLSGVSHELRTPLTAIIGLSQLLQKKYYGNLNAKQMEYIDDILDSSNHLLSLINDILDLAKIEAGKSTLEITEARIGELMESSLLLVKESAHKKGLTLRLDIPEEILGQRIVVDKRRFRQIMLNLLANAIKFTSKGAVTVNAEMKADHLEIVVADTGIGIGGEEQKKIFDAFYQIKSGTTGKSPGTGLGLSLAKRFVEQHRGKIWVESAGAGTGSRFHFTIARQLPNESINRHE